VYKQTHAKCIVGIHQLELYIAGLLTKRNSSTVTPISRYIDLSAAFCTFPIVNVGVFDLQSERMRVRLIRRRRFRIPTYYILLYPVRILLSGGGNNY